MTSSYSTPEVCTSSRANEAGRPGGGGGAAQGLTGAAPGGRMLLTVLQVMVLGFLSNKRLGDHLPSGVRRCQPAAPRRTEQEPRLCPGAAPGAAAFAASAGGPGSVLTPIAVCPA